MTKKQTAAQIRGMKEFGSEVTASKKKAVAALKAAGIMTASGKVKPQFRRALKIAS